jgi:prophage regulatory protein
MKTFVVHKPPAASGVRLLDNKALKDKGIPYSTNHLRMLCNDGKFPLPVHLSSNRKAWIESEIDQWILEKQRERKA